MTKKTINVCLIIVVLSVWGLAGYRYLKNYLFHEEFRQEGTTPTANIKSLTAARDTFLLKPLERDPFLNAVVLPEMHHTASKAIRKTKGYSAKPSNTSKVDTNWPDIQYHGFIKSGKKGEVALIYINGSMYKMQAGDSKNSVTLKKIFKDSVAVVFLRQNRFVRKHL